MRRIIIESPFSPSNGLTVDENLTYLRACMNDALDRGEAPFASHAIYTQPGVLDDTVADERRLGIDAGFAWHEVADAVVVYCDLGLSRGMRQGIRNAQRLGLPVEWRSLCAQLVARRVTRAVAEMALHRTSTMQADDVPHQAGRMLLHRLTSKHAA